MAVEPTIAEMLTNVRVAINNALVVGGSVEWAYNGRTVKHDYSQLMKIESNLLARQSSENPPGDSRSLAGFVRPS